MMRGKNRLQSAITTKTQKNKLRTLETVDTIPEYYTGQNLFVGFPGKMNTITGTGSPHLTKTRAGVRDSLQDSDLQSSMILHDQLSEMIQKRPQTSKLGSKKDYYNSKSKRMMKNLNVKSNFLSTNTLKTNLDSDRRMSK